MEYGICIMPVIPLRKEPDDRSEILTQILFGESVRIYEVRGKWLSVEADLDYYPGWVDLKQIEILEQKEYDRLKGSPLFLSAEPLTQVLTMDGHRMWVPAGSSFPGLNSQRMTISANSFTVNGEAKAFARGTANGLLESAMSFLNAPYLWGGRTHLGIDCSGLTQAAYRLNGINIPRDASQQASSGETINFLSDAHPGDLAFFDDKEGRITHVGIIRDAHSIIHASGKVRVDTLDHQGIFKNETKSYSHQLRLIRRIMED